MHLADLNWLSMLLPKFLFVFHKEAALSEGLLSPIPRCFALCVYSYVKVMTDQKTPKGNMDGNSVIPPLENLHLVIMNE